MRKSNIVLGLGIGFIVLAIASCFIEISAQILATLSVSSLLFTISQTINSFLSSKTEEDYKRYETFKSAGQIDLDEKWDLFFKWYMKSLVSGKKEKNLELAGNIVEVLSFVVLVAGLVIPVKMFDIEWVGEMCTFLSFGILFFSLWLTELSRRRIEQWGELQLYSVLFKEKDKDTLSNVVNGGEENGQT